MEILLHSGIEHPNTLWIAITAVITFILGVGVGVYSQAIRRLVSSAAAEQ